MKKTIDFDAFLADASRLLEQSTGSDTPTKLMHLVSDFCINYKNGGYYQGERLFNFLKNKNNPAEVSERLINFLESERLVQKMSGRDRRGTDFQNEDVRGSLLKVAQYIRRVCDLTCQLLKEEGDSTPDQRLRKTIVWLELFWYSKLVQWGSDKTLDLNNFLLNRYDFLFKYINYIHRMKSDIFTKEDLKNFSEHAQSLQ